MSQLDPHIFRAYDIRGKAHTQITEEGCLLIGKGFGTILRTLYEKDHPTVAVGRDARTHGPVFEKALIEGLVSTGCHVLVIGETPSPINYFTICKQNLDGGVQITASHNPAGDNGFKLQIRDADAFSGEDIQELYKRIEREEFVEGDGSQEEFDSVTSYVLHLSEMFADVGKGLSIAIDGGNGIAGPVYSTILRAVGCNVTGLFIDPDGTFPNHPADPSKPDTLKDLQKTVHDENLDLGFGFDGDGDRVGVVDEHGKIRTADEILLLLAQDHLSRNTGGSVVFTVSNSGTLQTEIERWGGKPVMCIVGHSYVEHAMQKCGSLLGGEQSGHFFCAEDYFSFDDALVATLRLLRIVQQSGKPLSELCKDFPTVYQTPEKRPHCPDDKKTEVIARITKHFSEEFPVETMDGARIDFGDGAWAGIRQSNTSPCISICLEARSPEKLKEIEGVVHAHLKTYPEITL
jgi:phosphomannomutase / phosphoglucomutase